MTVELPALLLQFQPESEELRSRHKYDQAARGFVKQLDNVSTPHWLKSADTPQDVLEVRTLERLVSWVCDRLTRARYSTPPPTR